MIRFFLQIVGVTVNFAKVYIEELFISSTVYISIVFKIEAVVGCC